MKTKLKSFLQSYLWLPPLIGLILYFQVLNFEASWGDDTLMIVPRTKDFHLMLESFYRQLNNKNFDPFGVVQSFIINKIFGEHSYPFGFHLYSLILHVIASVLLTLILFKITKNKFISLLVVCLWAVHPVNVEIVTRLGISTFHLAAAVFCLASTLCFLKLIEVNNEKEYLKFSLLGFLFFLISITSIEQYLFFPLTLFLILIYFKGKNFFFEKKYINYIIFPIIIFYPIYFLWRYFAFGKNLFYAGEMIIPWTDLGSFKDIAFRACWLCPQLIVHYLRLFLYPDFLSESKADWYMVGDSLFSPYSLFCQGLVICLIISAFLLFKKIPLFSIGITWFFFSMILVLQIIPLFSIIDEHYCYLSLVGILISIFSLLMHFQRSISKKLILGIFIPVFILLIWRTSLYIPSGKDFFSLSIYNAQEAPICIKPLKIFNTIQKAKETNKSLPPWINEKAFDGSFNQWIKECFGKEINLSQKFGPIQAPYNYYSYRMAFLLFSRSGQVNNFKQAIKEAIQTKNTWLGYFECGTFLYIAGYLEDAWIFFNSAIQSNPTHTLIYSPDLIDIAIKTNKIKEAEALIKRFISLSPRSAFPYLFAGEFYKRIDKTDEAKKFFLLGISPKLIPSNDQTFYVNAVNFFIQHKMKYLAKKSLEVYLKYNPFDEKAKELEVSLEKSS